MIQSIELTNFQSHKHTRLELDPGVNAIIGPSDSGKTAILRAINWSLTNRPLGDAFRSSWGGDTEVAIEMEGGGVARGIDKKGGYYLVPGQSAPLRALRTEVPEEVTKAFNLTDINVQRQLDAPFLLSESPGEVARVLNRVVQLDDIDRSLAEINSRVLSASRTLKSEESRAEEIAEELEGYAVLGVAEEKLAAVEVLSTNHARLVGAGLRLSGLLDSIVEATRNRDRYPDTSTAESLANQLMSKVGTLDQCQRRQTQLAWLITSAEADHQFLEDTRSTRRVERILKDLEQRNAQKEEEDRSASSLRDLLTRLDKGHTYLQECATQLSQLEDEFHQLMPSTCPLCGQEVSP